jgi:SAM domain (Sterile alpha motif)
LKTRHLLPRHFGASAGESTSGSVSSLMRGCCSSEPEDHRMDVAAWLQGLGLERYAPAFRENEIDWDALPKLSAEDLIHDRRRMRARSKPSAIERTML